MNTAVAMRNDTAGYVLVAGWRLESGEVVEDGRAEGYCGIDHATRLRYSNTRWINRCT